jgi:hypothetical protein
MSPQEVINLIGSKFISDPDFVISVNDQVVTFEDLQGVKLSIPNEANGFGTVTIKRFDSSSGRTSRHSGVAFWVNNRLVGSPSWEIAGDPLLDARSNVAKRLVYVVEADQLVDRVKPDWSGFYTNQAVSDFQRYVSEIIRQDLSDFNQEIQRERKRSALEQNRDAIRGLPRISQEEIVNFIKEVQTQSPTISERELNSAVKVFAKMEKSRSGYALLEKLATFDSVDFDDLNQILNEWSINDVKKVLSELRYRLGLIVQLEKLVENHDADELHDLQPLFERGLWIFGPEFESISYTSNRSLATVLKELFEPVLLKNPKLRPDFVCLPDTSIGLYSRDHFDSQHEVSGIGSVVIVELKRGGFEITNKEKDQALNYARLIRKSGKVGNFANITCYVLGAEIDFEAMNPIEETTGIAKTTVITQTYGTILKRAHARTFGLLQKIESATQWSVDSDLQEIVITDNLFEN